MIISHFNQKFSFETNSQQLKIRRQCEQISRGIFRPSQLGPGAGSLQCSADWGDHQP